MAAAMACAAAAGVAEDSADPLPAPDISQPPADEETWNWHVQNTDIVQGYPGFSSKYSGPDSLPNGGEVRESVRWI